MKSILLIPICLMWAAILPAQDESKESSDTSKFKIGKMNFLMWEDPTGEKPDTSGKKKKKEEEHSHIPFFGMGINGYMNSKNSMSPPAGYGFLKLLPEKSLWVSFNLLEGDIEIVKDHFYFISGMDLEFNNYRFTGNHRLVPGLDSVYGFKDTLISLKKSKLASTYLTFPFLFEINTAKKYKKSLHIQPGFVAGIRVGSHSKVVYEAGDVTYKPKAYEKFHLAPFRYGVTFRIGYGGIIFFANYMLSEMFDDGKVPALRPFTAGVLIL